MQDKLPPFKYCPMCATELTPPTRPGGGAYCPVHERSWYRNSSPTVGCAIVDATGTRALVSVRGIEPEKDRYDVPGGFLEPGEHPLDGLVREVREELGVEVTDISGPLLTEVHRYGPEGDFVLAMGFAARLAASESSPEPADDVAEVRWVEDADLDGLDFAWPHDRELVRRALAANRRA